MEFETGRRSTLARLQLSVQGLAGSLNSAKKVLVASTVLTAAFCGAIFGLTLVANEASKESHVTNGLLTTVDGQVVSTSINKGMTSLSELSAEDIAKQDFVSFSQDGADRFMQILGVQATASKKVINTIVGAFEVTEEGMTFAGDNVVLEASEADKAARKAQCKFCTNQGRNANCAMCNNGRGRVFAVAGRNPMCAVCNNEAGRKFQCQVCSNEGGRNAQCRICTNESGRSNQCMLCTNGRNGKCAFCTNEGRGFQCSFCSNQGRTAQRPGFECDEVGTLGSEAGDQDEACDETPDMPHCGGAANFDITAELAPGTGLVGTVIVNVDADSEDPHGQTDIDGLQAPNIILCDLARSQSRGGCYGDGSSGDGWVTFEHGR